MFSRHLLGPTRLACVISSNPQRWIRIRESSHTDFSHLGQDDSHSKWKSCWSLSPTELFIPHFYCLPPGPDFHELSNSLLYWLLWVFSARVSPWDPTTMTLDTPQAHSRGACNPPHPRRAETEPCSLLCESHLLTASKGLLITPAVTITFATYEMLSSVPGTLLTIFLTIVKTLQGKYCYG